MAKVSIIITSYNCAHYIKQSILSAANQTHEEMEIIVVDDGSTDATLTVALECAAEDARISVHPQIHSGKPSITRNAGIRLATGDYVCFLDGDDLYDPDKIRREADVLDANENLVGVFHDMKFINETGELRAGSFLRNVNFLEAANFYLKHMGRDVYFCTTDFYKFMYLNHPGIHTSTIMVRRSVLVNERLLFPEDVKMAEDVEFWWLLARGRELGWINQELSFYRRHDSNVTRDSERLHRDTLTVNLRNYELCAYSFDQRELDRCRKKIADLFFGLGYVYFLRGRPREARTCYKNAIGWNKSRKFVLPYLKTFVPIIVLAPFMKWRRSV